MILTAEQWRLAQNRGRWVSFTLLLVVTVVASEMPWWAKLLAWAWWCNSIAPPFTQHKDH